MDEFRRRLMIPKKVEEPREKYLTIEALEDGLQVSFTSRIYYNKDGEWVLLSSGNSTPSISTGEKISFKAELTPARGGIGTFTITKKCNLLGNCMSLLFGDNANEEVSLLGYSNAFSALFENCSTIINVSKNFLPATILDSYCYYEMFYNCSNMVSPPELPATTLTKFCYYGMFYNCTSLRTAPLLPAETLAESCYSRMFYGCSALTTPLVELPATTLAPKCYQYMFCKCTAMQTAPILPAATLVSQCYRYMFSYCENLRLITMLATDVSATNCLQGWVNGVHSNGVFRKNEDATWVIYGINGIPDGWEVYATPSI